MNVLVACEESQRVCTAFREKGHRAFSCDIMECSGGHPEWHIQGDVRKILNPKEQTLITEKASYKWYGIKFYTTDGELHIWEGKWDLIIAHPPCTDLAVSGARHFAKKQKDGRQQKSIVFFMEVALSDCDKIAVENPVCIMSSAWRKPDQIVQPYWFGHPYRKTTCLWLKGLQPLKPTNMVRPGEFDEHGFSKNFATRYAVDENGKILSWNDPRTAKARSKTPLGLAKAMAEQWG